MIDDIAGKLVPARHEYAESVNELSAAANVPPCLVYAIRLNETSEGDPPTVLEDGANPDTGLLPNGDNAGHGIMQLTSSWPSDWANPSSNIEYAIAHFIKPDLEQAVIDTGLQGDGLIRFVGAAYNSGYGAALRNHNLGDVDLGDTNRYGDRVLKHFNDLIAEAEG